MKILLLARKVDVYAFRAILFIFNLHKEADRSCLTNLQKIQKCTQGDKLSSGFDWVLFQMKNGLCMELNHKILLGLSAKFPFLNYSNPM